MFIHFCAVQNLYEYVDGGLGIAPRVDLPKVFRLMVTTSDHREKPVQFLAIMAVFRELHVHVGLQNMAIERISTL